MRSDQVRAFYAALGIELPAWSTREAPVRCFAHPDAHNRSDRSPSCSVSLASGAWNCHGCGAHGGAYDAALAIGHTPRSAMELLIAHGLAEPRARDDWGPGRATTTPDPRARSAPAPPDSRSELAWNEADVRMCAETLDANGHMIRRLTLERAWGGRIIRELGVGFDGARITIPVRSAQGHLRGVLRYDPFGRRDPKMRSVPGTRLGLMPHPAYESSQHVILVEGPPDMIAARSCGLPAIATPGTSAWRPCWATLFAGKRVTIVMDCDASGRRAANEIATEPEPSRQRDRARRPVARPPRRLRPHRPHPRAAAHAVGSEGSAHDHFAPASCRVPPTQHTAGLCPPSPGGLTMTEIPDANYTQGGPSGDPRRGSRAARLRGLARRRPGDRRGGPRLHRSPDRWAPRILGGAARSRARQRHGRLGR